MNMLTAIVCCGTLMLGPGTVSAAESSDSQEGLSNREAGPAGPSLAGSSQPGASDTGDLDKCGATTSAGVLYQRFCMLEQQRAVIEADDFKWGDPDCGCTPWLKSFLTYGLYPVWAKSEEGPANFERWTRVGYFALTPDKEGHLHPPRQWLKKSGKRKQADLVPQRFGTAIDLVISNNKWDFEGKTTPGLALHKTYALVGLVDDIVEIVKTYGFNGVTIDFDIAPLRGRKEVLHDYKHAYISFIRHLRKALQAERRGYGLHIMLGYYPGFADQVFAKPDLEELANFVDLILFMPNLSPTTDKTPRGMERYDDYFKDFSYGDLAPFEKKVVFLFQSESKALNQEMEDLNSNRFGGVGIWAPNQRSESDVVQYVHDDVVVQGTDIVERTLQSAPSNAFCKLVCPNRAVIGTVMSMGILIYGVGYLLWAFIPGVWLRRTVKTYRLAVGAGALILFLLFLSLGYCVPVRWPGFQGAAVLTILMLMALWILKKYFDKKREAGYP
ncbi:MAG: hypothetical protein OJF50_003781 [Nitrospira sp.]|jgi:hypothetical protein|nr:hypothetical protein [Nitrospira sp.]